MGHLNKQNKQMVKMCNKRNTTTGYTQTKEVHVDFCIANLIDVLNRFDELQTLACCCGHKKYDMSIVVKDSQGKVWELMSGISLYRKKRFYVKDKEGYYYIPEVEAETVRLPPQPKGRGFRRVS